jgi:hypothetical protein
MSCPCCGGRRDVVHREAQALSSFGARHAEGARAKRGPRSTFLPSRCPSRRAPAPVTRLSVPAPGTCFAGSHSPRPPPLAPPAPQRIAPPCSSASRLLWRSLTSHARASSATAPRLSDADRPQVAARRGISRFPYKERPHMPGSSTTPGRQGARVYRARPCCLPSG